jgi:hypothetical protein
MLSMSDNDPLRSVNLLAVGIGSSTAAAKFSQQTKLPLEFLYSVLVILVVRVYRMNRGCGFSGPCRQMLPSAGF